MSGWPPVTDGVYWSPSTGGQFSDPALATYQSPYQNFTINSIEFMIVLKMPVWLEAGQAGRFYAYFQHVVDGAIPFNMAPNNAFPTLSIIDGNGIAVSTGVVQGVTINTVFADPNGAGSFYCQVGLGASMQPGRYGVKWNATYQPNAVNGVAQPTLPIEAIRYFQATVTRSPSRFFLKNTSHL